MIRFYHGRVLAGGGPVNSAVMSLFVSSVGPRIEDSYSAQWVDCRRRDILFWTVVLTFIPAGVLIGGTFARLFHSDLAIGIVGGTWMVAFVVTHFYRTSWKCPRCHKPFFHGFWYYKILAEKCVHCRLPKYAPSGLSSNQRST